MTTLLFSRYRFTHTVNPIERVKWTILAFYFMQERPLLTPLCTAVHEQYFTYPSSYCFGTVLIVFEFETVGVSGDWDWYCPPKRQLVAVGWPRFLNGFSNIVWIFLSSIFEMYRPKCRYNISRRGGSVWSRFLGEDFSFKNGCWEHVEKF